MSTGPLLSSHWFQVAGLRPHLRSHVQFHRHVYRGEVWYVAEDRVAGKVHRFNLHAYRVIALLDGRRSLQALWDLLSGRLRDDSPTQDEVLQLLGQLNAADLLVSDRVPDMAELIERRGKQRRQRWRSRFANPLSLRLPLWDPDALLNRLQQRLRFMPGWMLPWLWLALVLPALLLAPAYWPELTHNLGDRLLAAENLWIMAIGFALLKAAHELAHGLAVKLRGGEVHELGLMLLLFYPVPYVDASQANAFVAKRDRLLVGAAGMLAELLIAALAFYLWLLVEPGFVRSLAYDMLVLGSISTVVFNANPLLRFDGYYMLADVIEVPNLGQRANQHWQYLATRHLFGVRSATPPPAGQSERRWLLAYAPAAFAYRLIVTVGIAWFVAQHYFVLGVLLALWALVSGLLWPVAKGLWALGHQAHFAERRPRVAAVLGGAVLLAGLLLFALPLPRHTQVQGVVGLPERALLRSQVDGFVEAQHHASETEIGPGELVLSLRNEELQAQERQQQARLEEAEAKLAAVWGQKPAEAEKLGEEVERERAALRKLHQEMAGLELRSHAGGRLLLPLAQDLPGSHVRRGQILGYLLGSHAAIVRVVVAQDQVERVQNHSEAIEVRLPQALARVLPARLLRAVPQAGHELPGAALGQQGGGPWLLDPQDEHGLKALERVFEFELELQAPLDPQDASTGLTQPPLGSRAYVSFTHPSEALGPRAWSLLRRLLLERLHV